MFLDVLQRVCIRIVAGLCARIFGKKIRRSKHATTFVLALNRNYFYTVLWAGF
jgi:hypothetical protein